MHANPQGYVWYPITWLFNLGGYSVYDLNLETVLHLLIGTWGAYRSALYYSMSKSASMLGALAYGLSGFAVGTSHMIGFTIGFAWLPWLVWSLSNLLQRPSTKNSVLLALFIYLQVTGAYVAFTIVMLYWMSGLILYFVMSRKIESYAKILSFGLLSAVLAIVLCSPYVYSIYDSLPYFSRASSLTYDPKQFAGNFNWSCFWSYFFPYINSSATGFSGVDVSLSNVFVGTIPFGLGLFALSKLKQNRLFIILTLLISILLALGNNTPIHKFFFDYVPGFSFFRHPSLFTLYSTFLLTMLAAKGAALISANSFKLRKQYVLVGGLVLVAALLVAYTNTNWNLFGEYVRNFISLSEKSPLNSYGHVAVQLTATILFLFFGLWSLYHQQSKTVVLAIVIELVICVQLAAPLNLFYSIPIQQIDQFVNESAEGLTNQAIGDELVHFENDSLPFTAGIWTNRSTYARVTGTDGYNPFVYTSLQELKNDASYNEVLKQGLVYSKDNIQFSDLKIGFNSISFKALSREPAVVKVNQNYHHNWQVKGNNSTALVPNDNGFMEFNIGKGLSTITLIYHNQHIQHMHFISKSILIVVFLYLLFNILTFIKSKN